MLFRSLPQVDVEGQALHRGSAELEPEADTEADRPAEAGTVPVPTR